MAGINNKETYLKRMWKYRIIILASACIIIQRLIFNFVINRLNLHYEGLIDIVLTLAIIIPPLFMTIKNRDKVYYEQEKAMYMALHDSLTGLPNRTLLHEQLKKAIRMNEKKKTDIAVMFLDLDKFKEINDTLGHEIGDKLLQAVSKRLQNCIREDDDVYRLGGDEFVMVFPSITDVQTIEIIASKILDVFKTPFSIDSCMLNVTTSIGISLCPGDSKEADMLIRNADMAMYKSKLYGKNRFEFYKKDLPNHKVKAVSKLNKVL